VERFAISMCDGENPERLLSDDIRYVVRKHSKIDAAIRARSDAISLWMIGDPENASVHLVLESPSQAATNILVVGDRIEKLALRLIYKADRHGTSRFSAARITSS
jgi:hypothetical protein